MSADENEPRTVQMPRMTDGNKVPTELEGRIQLHYGVSTDRGLKREINEDSFLAEYPIFAVADGMGGHEAGEVASSECVQVLRRELVEPDSRETSTASNVALALHHADLSIRRRTLGRAGTTATGVAVAEEDGQEYWLFFNVGDSRTYQLREGILKQVTVDHTEVQELIEAGEITEDQAHVHPRRHVVTRGLGMGSDNEADFWRLPVQHLDRVMVCSDGLTNELSTSQMTHVLMAHSDPQQAAESLVQEALRAGGRDNVTVVVVDAFSAEFPDERTTMPRQPVSEDTVPTAEQPVVVSATAASFNTAAVNQPGQADGGDVAAFVGTEADEPVAETSEDTGSQLGILRDILDAHSDDGNHDASEGQMRERNDE